MLSHVFPTVIGKVGDVAQLGERGVRNAEARGSIPLISTKRQSDKIQKSTKPVKNSGFFIDIQEHSFYIVFQEKQYLIKDQNTL